ncbi:MAG: SMP-30/gluconolactonase/LRE family protein [Janthinobacterium lividum]
MPDYAFIDPSFRRMVLPNAELKVLGEGFAWLEGPVWFADQQCLLVSDLPANRVMRWTASGGLSVFRDPSDFENGHTRDRQGRLVSCSHHGRITRTELDGRVTVLVDAYRGTPLNSPNDVVVKSDDTIWFSDPPYGLNTDYEGGKREALLPPSLYRFDPRDGSLTVVADDFQGPNGLAFSPDERLLYVSETGDQFDPDSPHHIRVFDVSDDGSRLARGRVFHEVSPGLSDGFRLDEEGHVWTGAGDGVHCLSPEGVLLGKIKLTNTVANLCFGGRNRAQLFICASHTLYSIYTNVRGV